MAYAVKEIFLTLQGEGFHAGRAAVFCRFTGCNLWSGRDADRARGAGGCARWCDTDFVGTDGEGGGRFDSADALADAVASRWPAEGGGRPFVVCTGGEPLLQLDAPLTAALKRRGFEVAIETNGTLRVPPGVDWVCVSPKDGGALVVDEGDELKLVYPQRECLPERFDGARFTHRFLQPMDGPDRAAHTEAVARYCMAHPAWRMSVQAHKLIGIP
ncbi:MAG: 7-carboxy-7-deazaguanine synthase [Polyangiales bacterium]